MNDKEALLEALMVERQTNPWWTKKADRRPPLEVIHDDDLTIAKRRRLLIETANEIHEGTA